MEALEAPLPPGFSRSALWTATVIFELIVHESWALNSYRHTTGGLPAESEVNRNGASMRCGEAGAPGTGKRTNVVEVVFAPVRDHPTQRRRLTRWPAKTRPAFLA